LDDELNDCAQAGAQLCKRIGRLDHTPANPGMREEEYKKGYRGTSRSNLSMGVRNLVNCVDGWMDDSDKGNIAALGHRRWCLNPPIRKVGLGRVQHFGALYVFDASRKEVHEYDFVAWPARGPMPGQFFRPHHAWCLSLNPRKY